MVYLGQKLFGLTLVIALVLASVDGRPPYFEYDDIEPGLPELSYIPYYPYPGPNRFPRSQLKGALGLTNMVEPEKRGVKYRQCYFNPISCFRK